MVQAISSLKKRGTLGNFFNLVKGGISALSGKKTSAKTAGFAFLQPFVDQAYGAADSSIDTDRRHRAVCYTGPAFQAGMQIHDMCLTFPDLENLVRTDLLAFAATDALFLLQLQGNDIFQIPKSLHGCLHLFPDNLFA
jgi:hypothetical protein